MSELRLRPVRLADEQQCRAAQTTLLASDDFAFALHLHDDTRWPDFVQTMANHAVGRDVGDGLVPATFLVAVVDGTIVGRSSIRHELNDFLREQGGHIGYAVLPAYRRRGYATEILRQSLIISRSLGIDSALVVCDDDNVGSITVIERCGALLESTADFGDGTIRRYWLS